jgi:hypothetical protein
LHDTGVRAGPALGLINSNTCKTGRNISTAVGYIVIVLLAARMMADQEPW